jgi:hypothetical protein
MEKAAIIRDTEGKTLALVMFMAGIIIWFLIDSSKPLAHDLVKAIAFFLFGLGLINLCKWKPWSELSSREKKMRIVFLAIIILLLAVLVLLVFLVR